MLANQHARALAVQISDQSILDLYLMRAAFVDLVDCSPATSALVDCALVQIEALDLEIVNARTAATAAEHAVQVLVALGGSVDPKTIEGALYARSQALVDAALAAGGAA